MLFNYTRVGQIAQKRFLEWEKKLPKDEPLWKAEAAEINKYAQGVILIRWRKRTRRVK